LPVATFDLTDAVILAALGPSIDYSLKIYHTDAMKRRNRTKAALLGFLSWGPMSGYDLRRVIDQSISNFWSESYGRIYPMLAELSKDGLVDCQKTVSDGGRPRNVYKLTKAGTADLDDWLAQPVSTAPPRDERLLKLFFGARTDVHNSRRLVEAYGIELGDRKQRYIDTRATLEAAKDAPEDRRFWLLTLRLGELRVDAELQWCEEALLELSDP